MRGSGGVTPGQRREALSYLLFPEARRKAPKARRPPPQHQEGAERAQKENSHLPHHSLSRAPRSRSRARRAAALSARAPAAGGGGRAATGPRGRRSGAGGREPEAGERKSKCVRSAPRGGGACRGALGASNEGGSKRGGKCEWMRCPRARTCRECISKSAACNRCAKGGRFGVMASTRRLIRLMQQRSLPFRLRPGGWIRHRGASA